MMNLYPQARDARGSSEILLVLSSQGLKSKHFDGQIRLFKSPCCGHSKKNNPSFSIREKNGLWKCFHCNKSGNWVSFCDLIGHFLDKKDRYVMDYREDYREDWTSYFIDKPRSSVSSGKYPDLVNYCHSRGISNETLDAFRVSNKWGVAVQFPIFSWHEDKWQRVNARNVKVKELDQDGPKNWFEVRGGPTHLMIGNHLLDLEAEQKRIIIFEGQWDVMTAYELGLRNVFSLPNGASNIHVGPMLKYIPEDWDIYICTDMDEAGQKAAESFFAQIGSERFKRMWLPHKDLNDWLKAEPELTAEQVLSTAKGISETSQVETDYIDFDEEDETDELPICNTPWPGLTDYIQGGFYSGQVTSVLAPSGSGKTTIVNHIGLHCVAQNIKCGLISLEDTRKQFIRKINLLTEGLDITKADRQKYLQATQLHGQKTTHQELVVEVDKLVIAGCKMIIIDNINYLDGSLDDQLNTFRNILNRVDNTDSHAIIVMQPKKIGAVQTVMSADMKGFSDLYQGVFNHINVCKTDDDNIRYLHVEKCRSKWPGSNANVLLAYDHESNLYTPTSNTPTQAEVPRLRVLMKHCKQG